MKCMQLCFDKLSTNGACYTPITLSLPKGE